MAKKSWKDMSPALRTGIIALVVVEGGLKVAALADLARRPADKVHGSKAVWAAAITGINALGAVPLGYFACHGVIPTGLGHDPGFATVHDAVAEHAGADSSLAH